MTSPKGLQVVIIRLMLFILMMMKIWKHGNFKQKDGQECFSLQARRSIILYLYLRFAFTVLCSKLILISLFLFLVVQYIFFLISNICIDKKGNPSTLEVNKGKEITIKNYKSLGNQ